MRASVQQGDYRAGRDGERELERIINQQRRLWNAKLSDGPHLLTTYASGVLETVWTSDEMPGGVAWEVDAYVLGVSADHTKAARYVLSGLFRRAGGDAIQVGATTVQVSVESVAGFDAALDVSGGSVITQVQDDGAETMSWSALMYVREVG